MINKFRAWDKRSKRMLPADTLYRLSQSPRSNGVFAVEGSIGKEMVTIFHTDLVLMPAVGQCDKNKVEAYLGDIIEHDGKTYEIKWCDEGMSFYCDGNDWIARYDGDSSGFDDDRARDLVTDEAGNVYITGESWGTNLDYATIMYNPNGVAQWVARYNGPGNGPDSAYAIVVDCLNNNVK